MEKEAVRGYLSRKKERRVIRREENRRLSEVAGAIEEWTKKIINDPSEEAYLLRGAVYLSAQKNRQAYADFSAAIAMNPLSCRGYYQLGQIHYLDREFELAILYYNKALMISPQDEMSRLKRGYCYQKVGKFQASYDDFTFLKDIGCEWVIVHIDSLLLKKGAEMIVQNKIAIKSQVATG